MAISIIGYAIVLGFMLLSEKFVRKDGEAKSFKVKGRYDKNSLFLIISIAFVLISSPLFNYFSIGTISSSFMGVVGLVLLIGGLVLRVFAMKTLGKYYTRSIFTSEGQKLNDKGIYGYVRHPGYSGTILAGIGFGLAQMNIITVLLVIFLEAFTYVVRIPKEENVLSENFGQDYNDYMKKTKRLIPFIY